MQLGQPQGMLELLQLAKAFAEVKKVQDAWVECLLPSELGDLNAMSLFICPVDPSERQRTCRKLGVG